MICSIYITTILPCNSWVIQGVLLEVAYKSRSHSVFGVWAVKTAASDTFVHSSFESDEIQQTVHNCQQYTKNMHTYMYESHSVEYYKERICLGYTDE